MKTDGDKLAELLAPYMIANDPALGRMRDFTVSLYEALRDRHSTFNDVPVLDGGVLYKDAVAKVRAYYESDPQSATVADAVELYCTEAKQ